MNLQERITNYKIINNNVAIIEFDETNHVIYEKSNEVKTIVTKYNDGRKINEKVIDSSEKIGYAVLPQKRFKDFNTNYLLSNIESDDNQMWNLKNEKIVPRYLSKTNDPSDAIESKIKKLYTEIVEPLKITLTSKRDWKEYGMSAGFVLSWPILLPYYLIAGRKKDHSGDGGLAVLMAPLLIPHMIKELIVPNEFKIDGYKMNDCKLITNEKEGCFAAVSLGYGEKNDLKFFQSLDILFSDGTSVDKNGFGINKEYNLKKFNEAKYFIQIEPEIKEKIRSIKKERSNHQKERSDLHKDLKEFDHKLVLEEIGFL